MDYSSNLLLTPQSKIILPHPTLRAKFIPMKSSAKRGEWK